MIMKQRSFNTIGVNMWNSTNSPITLNILYCELIKVSEYLGIPHRMQVFLALGSNIGKFPL